MPWTYRYCPASIQLPESSSIASCCLRCAKQLGTNPENECVRAHAFKACERCETLKEQCRPVPVFLQDRVEALRGIEDKEERIKACHELTVEAELFEWRCRKSEDEANRLLRSLNRNVFRLVQLKRMKMGLDPLGPEEEEMGPLEGGGRVV
ncbi:hypothetical protein N8T08_009725 [Aspergillus melleus]|uniref:Uncharacterized protein n=1 Tax=Aspergillus melleus TaxID=138277 RepID=A0ACC3ATP5_9EURO|nr:hypothetical protein N8T08_009725 [Aspergillus melleus]